VDDVGMKSLMFPLKASRNIWLSADKLVWEYPLKFKQLCNLGEAAVFSLSTAIA
jgi:hypothetical protein